MARRDLDSQLYSFLGGFWEATPCNSSIPHSPLGNYRESSFSPLAAYALTYIPAQDSAFHWACPWQSPSYFYLNLVEFRDRLRQAGESRGHEMEPAGQSPSIHTRVTEKPKQIDHSQCNKLIRLNMRHKYWKEEIN